MTTGDDGDPEAAICSRVESSKRVGTKGAGWLHRLRGDDWLSRPRQRRVTIEALAAQAIDFGAMAVECEAALGPLQRGLLAHELGVDDRALASLEVGWSGKYQSYTFPMRNGDGDICGIRLRRLNGSKWAVPGSRQGLFVPRHLPPDDLLLICEGPTDTAAMLGLGFSVVGRPSCTGGGSQLIGMVQTRGGFAPRGAVIVADGDGPGERGAWHLATTLVPYVPTVRIISPPSGFKDAREWVRGGVILATILSAIAEAPALQLTYGVKGVAR